MYHVIVCIIGRAAGKESSLYDGCAIYSLPFQNKPYIVALIKTAQNGAVLTRKHNICLYKKNKTSSNYHQNIILPGALMTQNINLME